MCTVKKNMKTNIFTISWKRKEILQKKCGFEIPEKR